MKFAKIRNYCEYHDIWYLKIPLDIPREIIKEVNDVYDNGFFVEHRYGDTAETGGWKSAAIHGWVKKGKDQNMGWHHTMNPSGYGISEEDVQWGWTELIEYAPEMKRWLRDRFPNKGSGVPGGYRRCRFMLLEPEGLITAHNDSDAKRDAEGRTRNVSSAINIAITQPEGCYLRRSDTKEELPFEECTGYWFDNGVSHEAYNGSKENRFHFIIHGGGNQQRHDLMLYALKKLVGNDVEKDLEKFGNENSRN